MHLSGEQMKNARWLLLALCLASCDGADNTAHISQQASTKLQSLLDANFGEGHAKIEKIDFVRVEGTKFNGSASISSRGTTFTVPVAITSDGKTTIITTNEDELGERLAKTMEKWLSTLKDRYSNHVLEKDFIVLFPKTLQADRTLFGDHLQVATPILSDGDYYFGTGCFPHRCGSDQAAWAVNKRDGSAAAIVMQTLVGVEGGMPEHVRFRVYSPLGEPLPVPLSQWGQENGMTSMNVVTDPAKYEANPN